jgi:hypothetical protein
MSPLVRNLLILAAVSVAIVALNQETSLVTASRLLQIAFVIAIAAVAYLVWRDFGRREISLWPTAQQYVFYGACGLFLVDLAWFFYAHPSGPDALVFFLVAAACVFSAWRIWRRQTTYGG